MHSRKTVVMQRLQDLVRVGYRYWTSGTIPADKVKHLRVKFDEKYGTEADRVRRQRRKRHGVGNAYLVVWCPKGSVRARWWLLAEDGHAALAVEQMNDAGERPTRLTIASEVAGTEPDYELVRVDGRWTWRLTEFAISRWRRRIREAVTEKDRERRAQLWRQFCWSIRRMPGFRGVRQGAWDVIRRARGEWKRHCRGAAPCQPSLPRYLRRLPHRVE